MSLTIYALSHFSIIIAQDSSMNTTELNIKGLALYYLGDYNGSIKYYDKALVLDPNNKAILNNKGLALDGSGNLNGSVASIAYYDKALSIDPNYIIALSNKGRALDNLGNYTGAIKHFDKALSINQNFKDALDNKGYALFKLGKYNETIAYLDKALAIDPYDKYALEYIGDSIGNLGNYTGAIKYFDKALSIDPNFKYALTDKGLSLFHLGRYNESIKYVDKALAINQNKPTNSTIDVSYITYENATMGFKIQYPGDWIKSETENKSKQCEGSVCLNFDIQRVQFVSSSIPKPIVSVHGVLGVTVTNSSDPLSYQDWLTWTLPTKIKSMQSIGYKIIQSNEIHILGLPAYQIVADEGGFTSTILTFINDKKTYEITYTIPKNDPSMPIFEHLIDSFKFISSSDSNATLTNELG